MATCSACVHAVVCRFYINSLLEAGGEHISADLRKEMSECLSGDACKTFFSYKRVAALPQPVEPGDKLWYILNGLDTIDLQEYKTTRGSSAVGDDPDVVFDVSTRGVWIDGVRRKDTEPISFGDCFFVSWDEFGKTYFLSREAAEQALKERENDEGEDTGVSDSGSKESSRGRATQ